MSTHKFEPHRAVEIIAPMYGSGYRIGGKLVLTAAHLLGEVGSNCEVRDKQSFGQENAQVVWRAQNLDVALIELPPKIADVEPITFGQLPKSTAGEKLSFQMYSYPLWARTQRGQGSAAGGRQIEGSIYLSDHSPDGLLVLEAERLPPELTSSESAWAGASGSAIVCDGLVIAVQSQHQNPNRPASLEASPLWLTYADELWQQLLSKYGIDPHPQMIGLSSTESSGQTVKAASSRVVTMKSKAFGKHLKVLQEDYDAVAEQISYTTNAATRNKLKRQLDSIEREMNELASELDQLEQRI